MSKSKLERKAKREAKKALRRIHPKTKVICCLVLIAGVALGALAALYVGKNDRFLLNGESYYSVDMGSTYRYREEGVTAVCFGRDVSAKLTVTTDLEKDGEGNYIIPTDKEGVYTIVYTVDALKFGEYAPNGQIKRIRTFAVNISEEDGRHE